MSPLVPYTEKGMNFSDLSGPSPRTEPDQNIQHLLYSVGNNIRLHLDGDGGEYLIKGRPRNIRALVIHNGQLVDAGFDGEILYTETDELIASIGADIPALAIHKGELVHAENHWDPHASPESCTSRIIYTKTGETIATRLNYTHAIAVFGGYLIDAGDDRRIHFTETEFKQITEAPKEILALVDNQGLLVHAEFMGSGTWPSSRILYSGQRKRIAERPGPVNALAVYNGRLIDAGTYGKILYTETEEPIVEADNPICSLLPIDQGLADRLLQLSEVKRIE
jgi:hypothetical protein